MTKAHAWPALPLLPWRDTCDTLHMYAQIVGKIRLALSPPEPQWAHVALYVTPHGLTTGPVPFGERSFQIDFDFVEHRLDVIVSDGQSRYLQLLPRSVADFYGWLMQALRELSIDVRVWPMPVEVADPIRFDEDTVHAAYDPIAAERFARALVLVDTALKRHRAPFRLRHTLVQFFFGTFDLAYARFSGRPATPPRGGDVIMRRAMDAEEICAGFWPGDERFPEPAFWCYAFPKPPGAETIAVRPNAAFWSETMGEFVLRYDDVRNAASPSDMLGEFFASTFDGLSKLAKWPTLSP
ncbi:MAG: DUF5996 family protein [Candidatus Tumulicola sp.]